MHKSKAENVSCLISIDRLKQYITLNDVCNYIGLPIVCLDQLRKIEPSSEFKSEDLRDNDYHLKKIKFFILNGIDKSIDVDCLCRNNQIYDWPVIIDGRHRYIAALLRRDKTIKATFTGSEQLFNYLTFKSHIRPRSGLT